MLLAGSWSANFYIYTDKVLAQSTEIPKKLNCQTRYSIQYTRDNMTNRSSAFIYIYV